MDGCSNRDLTVDQQYFIQTFTENKLSGRNEGRQEGHNSPGAESRITKWVTNHCWGRGMATEGVEKS